MKKFKQLDGTEIEVEDNQCRGCWMNENPNMIPTLAKPIIENKNIIVRQDVEFPVPGFFIVSIRQHIGSIAELSEETYEEFSKTLYYVRKGLKEVMNVKKAQIYHEEKLTSSHIHFWVLPLWEEKLKGKLKNPRIYDGTIIDYLKSFELSIYQNKIKQCNNKLSKYLLNQETLKKMRFSSEWTEK